MLARCSRPGCLRVDQPLVAVGSGCFGFLSPVVVIFTGARVTAPRRQRDEARDQLRRLTAPIDVPALAQEFSDWIKAKRAAIPDYGLRIIPSVWDSAEVQSSYEKRSDQLAQLQAQALAEYHQQFRRRVMEATGAPDADAPKSISDLEALAERLKGIVEQRTREERLAVARDTFVGQTHRDILDGLITSMQLVVPNGLPIDYGDKPGGEQQWERSFRAHFNALATSLDAYHAVIADRSAAEQALAESLQPLVTKWGFEDSAVDGNGAGNVFIAVTRLRALRQQLDEDHTVRMRCVEDVVSPEGEKRWSGYLQSDQGETKAAEFDEDVSEFSESGTANLQARVASVEANLQALFDEMQRSETARAISAAQDAASDLRQPIIDRLARQRVLTGIRFAEDCPFCLDEALG